MNSTLLKASIALVPVSALVAYSATAFVKLRTVPTLLQLIGAACLVLVVLTHVAEGLHLFPAMGWGEPSRVGHYLDLSSAALGVTLTPLGYIRQRRASRRMTTAVEL
jgi:hypothetical protein